MLRMGPAQQRLEARHLAGLHVIKRLIVNLQFAVADRGSQRLAQFGFALHHVIHARGEEGGAARAQFLGCVAGKIDVTHRVAHGLAVARHQGGTSRDADVQFRVEDDGGL